MPKNREHVSKNYLFLIANKSIKGKLLERYYLNWRDNIKKKFALVISNRYFRRIMNLGKN